MKIIDNSIIRLLLSAMIVITWSVLFQTSQAAERTTYYVNDLLGSPVAATDNNGQVVWREEYRPYGERMLYEDGGTNTQWYTGKVHEESFGLSYFGARWYHPELGRFTGMDPMDVDPNNLHSFNRYAYGNNNPYKFVDPDGNIGWFAPLLWTVGQEAVGAITGLPVGKKQLATSVFKKGAVKQATKGATQKLSKVNKKVREETIGGGKFTKITKVIPGKGPGQSRSEMEFVKNSDGKLIRSRKFSFDRGNKFQHKKPARGGPEGRPANEN